MIPSTTSRQADRFLISFVNQPFEWLSRRKRFSKLLPRQPRQFLAEPNLTGDSLVRRRVQLWRESLQAAWVREAPTERRVAMTQVIAIYGAMAFSSSDPVTGGAMAQSFGNALARMTRRGSTHTGLKPDLFLQVLHRAREISEKMRKCANSACTHPFFIARRRSEKNCSLECGKIGKRTANLKWWNDHGKEWRANRLKQKPQRRGGK